MQWLFTARKLLSSALSPTRPRWCASFSTSLLFDTTQLQFKESASQFAQENIAPHVAEIDRSNYFPKEANLWKLMGDFNLHGITSPGLVVPDVPLEGTEILRSEANTHNIELCAHQPNNDCGFYVARYMEEIVSNRMTHYDIDECCRIIGSDDGYTQQGVDETRDNWVRYVMDLAIIE